MAKEIASCYVQRLGHAFTFYRSADRFNGGVGLHSLYKLRVLKLPSYLTVLNNISLLTSITPVSHLISHMEVFVFGIPDHTSGLTVFGY